MVKKKQTKFSSLDVLPIKEYKDLQPLKRPVNPILPDIQQGSSVIMIGIVKSGKSVTVSNLILNPAFYQGLFDTIHIISSSIESDISSRFLLEEPNIIINTSYNDKIIDDIIASQSEHQRKDMPQIALIADDILGSGAVGRNSRLMNLFARYRHYNIKLLCVLSQTYKGLPPIVRTNATNAIIFWNIWSDMELGKIDEDLSSFCGGDGCFTKMYKKYVQKIPYSFLYLNYEQNKVYFKFERVLHDNLAKNNNDVSENESDLTTDSDSSSDSSDYSDSE
tara:strand:+ start:17 stop:850 length:834 start_codon:yes stop_codon:yes gene_type:complete